MERSMRTGDPARRPGRRFIAHRSGGETEPVSAVASARFRRRAAVVLMLAAVGGGIWTATRPLPPPVPVDLSGARIAHRVERFDLLDVQGRRHSRDEWRGARAVALVVLGLDCRPTREQLPRIRKLIREFGPRGVLFYGVVPDPETTSEGPAAFEREAALGVPILVDPEQRVVRGIGTRVTPEISVLDPDEGVVLYGGRIDGELEASRESPARHALESLVANTMPSPSEADGPGTLLWLPKPARATSTEVTYHGEVGPLLNRRCTACHRKGEVAPFALTSYRDAAKRARYLAEVAAERKMPPWKPKAGHGAFRDDLRLTEGEIETLRRWADAGAPEGEPTGEREDEPAVSADGWALGTPQVAHTISKPFAIPADGEDVYRAFVIPTPKDRDLAVLAFEFRPGNRRVVHHAKMFLDPTGESLRRESEDAVPGFASSGAADLGRPAIWEWTPGTRPQFAPEGAGYRIPAGSTLVLFVHYHPTGKPESDQSSVGLYLSDGPPSKEVVFVALGSSRIDIPPGAARHRVTASRTFHQNLRAFCVLPHGHYLLRELSLTARRPDGSIERMLWIDDWDFNWQGQYQYVRPIHLPAGTRLDLVAYYDNSADNPRNPSRPPKRVKFGPSSLDEMLGANLLCLPDSGR